MMKPQAMGSQEFFLALCRELGLSPTDTDETEILWAIYALKIDARQVDRYEVFVAEYMGEVIGFINWHKRRDGWATIYEVAVHKAYTGRKFGQALVQAVTSPRQLKCTTDNPANEFYEHIGMVNRDTVAGRKRLLNVWLQQAS